MELSKYFAVRILLKDFSGSRAARTKCELSCSISFDLIHCGFSACSGEAVAGLAWLGMATDHFRLPHRLITTPNPVAIENPDAPTATNLGTLDALTA